MESTSHSWDEPSPSGEWNELSQESLDDVRELALLQKALLATAGVHVLVLLAFLFVPNGLRATLSTAYLIVAIAAATSVLLYAVSRLSAVRSIALALGTLLPVVGIVIALALAVRATSELKAAHAPLGWFGVPWRQIPSD